MIRYIQLAKVIGQPTHRTGKEVFETREEAVADIRTFISKWNEENVSNTNARFYSEEDFDVECISCSAVYNGEDHLLVVFHAGDDWQVMIDWEDERWFTIHTKDVRGSLLDTVRTSCERLGMEYKPENLEVE